MIDAPTSRRSARQRVEKGEQEQAIGRSRGGRNTKIHALADAKGRPIAILLIGDEAHDCPVERLIRRVKPPKRMLGDKAYDSATGLTIMSILRRLPRHGSIRSSAGSLSSPESRSSEVSTPPSGSSRPTSVPSSTCTTETRSPSNGPSQQTRFWLPSNASATKPSRLYAANFRFT